MNKRSWVCLMYHDVLPDAQVSGGGPERFSVPLSSFELVLDSISSRGLRGCSLGEALSVRDGQGKVAITFDDGADGQCRYAAPVLADRGMTATFFVTTDWIGKPGYMMAEELRELGSMGMSVQSHTRTHPFLGELDRTQLLAELRGSKEDLDTLLNQDTTELSLPGGNAPRQALRHVIGEAGYRYVAGSRWGRNPDRVVPNPEGPWLKRCTMRGAISEREVDRVLDGHWSSVLRLGKEASLNGIRAMMGPSRYARWRREFLDWVR